MKALLSALIIFCLVAQAKATNYVWSGSASTSLSTSSNWTPNGIPATNSVITLTGTGTYHPSSGTCVCSSGTLQSGLNLSGGTITITGATFISSGTISGIATFSGTSATNCTLSNSGTVTGGTINTRVVNYTTIAGGTFNAQVTSGGEFNSQPMTVTGGTFNSGLATSGYVDTLTGFLVSSTGTLQYNTFDRVTGGTLAGAFQFANSTIAVLTVTNTAAWMSTADGVPLYTTSFGGADVAAASNVKSGVLNCGSTGSYAGGMTVTAGTTTLSGGTLTAAAITGPYSVTGSTVNVTGFAGTSYSGSNVVVGSGTAQIGTNLVTPSAPVSRGRGILSGGAMAILPVWAAAGPFVEQVAIQATAGMIVMYFFYLLLRRLRPISDNTETRSLWRRLLDRLRNEDLRLAKRSLLQGLERSRRSRAGEKTLVQICDDLRTLERRQ